MKKKMKGKDPEEIFGNIYRKCISKGITPTEISKLSSVKRLLTKKHEEDSTSDGFRFRYLAVIVCALSVIVLFDVQLKEGFTKMWFYLFDFDIQSEMCTINMPPDIQTIFMPPVDCTMCENLTMVDRVSNISPELFESRYAYSAVPVIIKDGTKDWTAMQVFSFEFFRALYLGDGGDWRSFDRECQFFPYQTEFRSLAQALNMSEERAAKPWYIGWSNCDTKIGNILRRHYRRPYFLPLQSESTNMDWIFMGTPGYGAHMHVDHVANPSWQAQIKGTKKWTLEPVPECYRECRTLEVTVQPGEVIVLDTNRWYHKTLTVGEDLSITIGSEYD